MQANIDLIHLFSTYPTIHKRLSLLVLGFNISVHTRVVYCFKMDIESSNQKMQYTV